MLQFRDYKSLSPHRGILRPIEDRASPNSSGSLDDSGSLGAGSGLAKLRRRSGTEKADRMVEPSRPIPNPIQLLAQGRILVVPEKVDTVPSFRVPTQRLTPNKRICLHPSSLRPRRNRSGATSRFMRHGIFSRMEDDRMGLGNRRLGKNAAVAVALSHAVLPGV